MNPEQRGQFKIAIVAGLISGFMVFALSLVLETFGENYSLILISSFIIIAILIFLLWVADKILIRDKDLKP